MKPYQAYYFDDFTVGNEFETPRRTVTETDLIQFAMLSSDWNTVHTDALAAGDSTFGRRIVHGALGLTLATGLLQRTGMFEGSAVALLGYSEWRFTKPLFVGDTVYTRMRVLGLRPTSCGRRGIISRSIELVNQDGEIVQQGISDFMLWRNAEAAAQ
ncbi:MaoC/PaaZ C-terminal domain-containing protein [Mycolicibacterium smegmatis]|uniref:MoaC domain protein n=1 Tax=Mycolicibacterium smegmatis (strain MKD8) TaxID=1214915 RepID=A0A2U9PIM2_MYCSE|nr:MaoC/PaaZ C-terminal domain-containing protein [Mycolicibacterium smegmatis]AWT51579.1 MoaC domain protein [Mycolicibacterium smegmatis MKD8]